MPADCRRRLPGPGGCGLCAGRPADSPRDGSQCADGPTHAHTLRPRPSRRSFPPAPDLSKAEARQELYRQYRRGESLPALAKRFCQTPSAIRRIIKGMRAARIMELPLDYVGHEQFVRLNSEKTVAEFWGGPRKALCPKTRLPSGVPPYLASLYGVPLLPWIAIGPSLSEDELPQVPGQRLRATRPESAAEQLMDRIQKLSDEARQPPSPNRSSVPTCAWWFRSPSGTWVRRRNLLRAVSDGNVAYRAVQKFDVARG